MTNIAENVTQEIKDTVKKALVKAIDGGELPQPEIPEIAVETPREKKHGDFSRNIPVQLSKQV